MSVGINETSITGYFKDEKKSPHLHAGSSLNVAVREGLIRCAHPAGVMAISVPDVQQAKACCRTLSRILTPLSWCYMRKKSPHLHAGSSLNVAVREGFEPSIRCRIHTFQACSFSHSDTSPYCFCYPLTGATGRYYRESAPFGQA